MGDFEGEVELLPAVVKSLYITVSLFEYVH